MDAEDVEYLDTLLSEHKNHSKYNKFRNEIIRICDAHSSPSLSLDDILERERAKVLSYDISEIERAAKALDKAEKLLSKNDNSEYASYVIGTSIFPKSRKEELHARMQDFLLDIKIYKDLLHHIKDLYEPPSFKKGRPKVDNGLSLFFIAKAMYDYIGVEPASTEGGLLDILYDFYCDNTGQAKGDTRRILVDFIAQYKRMHEGVI